jgi:hypothetical protein
MRKLIRRTRQQDFATPSGDWTLDVAEALEFPDLIVITADLRKRYGPDDIELYYAFGEHAPTEFDFCQGSAARQAA